MLDVARTRPTASSVVRRLAAIHGADFARAYWRREFPALIADRGYAAQALNPPRNKLERLISTREIDTLLRHPVTLDLEGILERGEVLIVAGAKATVGEDNTVLVTQLLLQLLHRALQAQHDQPETERRRVSLLIDEAHNVLTPSVAKMLAEGRSAGLDAVFAWQYSAQIRDEVIRSGVRSLLQSISIFRMREMEDARSLAGLAMEVYSDRISIDQDEQERLRFSPDDIVKLPIHRAINLWVADGVPRAGFLAAHAADGSSSTTSELARPPPRRPARARRPPPRRASATRSDLRRRRRTATPRAGDAPSTAPARRRRERRDGSARRGDDGRDGPQLTFDDARTADDVTISSDRSLSPRATSTRTATTAPPSSTTAATRIVPCALQPRDVAILRDVWRYKFLTAPQLLELWWPGRCARAGQRRLRKLFDAGYLERFRPITRRGSFPWTYHLGHDGHRLLQHAGIIDRRASASRPRAIYDYGHVLHELQLNAWVLAYRRAARRRAARLGRRDRHRAAAARPTADSCASTTTGPPRASATRSARLLRPDAVLEIARATTSQARARCLIEYDRTRRVDKNYGKFRRYDAFLSWWWRHTAVRRRRRTALRALRLPGRRSSASSSWPPPTASSPATAGIPASTPTATSTSAAGESSSRSNATCTPACSRPGGSPHSRTVIQAARLTCDTCAYPAMTPAQSVHIRWICRAPPSQTKPAVTIAG